MSHTHEIKVPEKSPRKVGIVASDGRNKTRKVSIRFSVRHPKYGKYMRRETVLHVHDEANVSKKGDRVEIAECRPISKTKSWVLLRVLESAAVVEE
jgi:small subunit ribosomal protein S17